MGLSIEIRRMAADTLDAIGRVDRTESVKALYVPRLTPDGMGLMLERAEQEPPLMIPPWNSEGSQRRAGQWRPQMEEGGVLLGAFREGELIGFTIMGPEQRDGSAELCALFVDASHRRSGVGSLLMDEIERVAGQRGIGSLFLYSNETESSVRFYRKRGCWIVGLVDKALVKHLPGAVIFAKRVTSLGETPNQRMQPTSLSVTPAASAAAPLAPTAPASTLAADARMLGVITAVVGQASRSVYLVLARSARQSYRRWT